MGGLSKGGPSPVGYWRAVVVAVALAATVYKLQIASTTFGTDDVKSWLSFAAGVREHGYAGAYGHQYYTQYNHPPLSGALLVVVNALVDAGFSPLPYLIRVPASVADLGTGLLVFELARQIRPAWSAALAGVLVSASPALVVVSGFHGNTDPVFVMFSLLAVYLLVVRRWAFAAGVALAAALSIKLIPVVLVPLLLVVLVRAGWRALAAFTAGVLAVAVPLWGPVLLTNWPAFSANVLGYSGISLREWGLSQFVVWAEMPPDWVDWLGGPGRFVALAISGIVPAVLVAFRPAAVIPATGLALASFLLLSPAFGMQYVVWPLAAAYLVGNGAATLYNAVASWFVLVVYSYWNGAPPGSWYEGVAEPFRPQDLFLMTTTWLALALVVGAGLRHPTLSRPVPSGPHRPTPPPVEPESDNPPAAAPVEGRTLDRSIVTGASAGPR